MEIKKGKKEYILYIFIYKDNSEVILPTATLVKPGKSINVKLTTAKDKPLLSDSRKVCQGKFNFIH